MKKCNYCGKEISYNDIYCSDECQIQANKFYELREKFEKMFSIINCIAIFGIPAGLFLMPLVGFIGAVIVTFSCVVLAILILVFPFATENMIAKHKLKKAIFRTRLFSIIIFAFGIGVLLFNIFAM